MLSNFLARWQAVADYMVQQRGFISTKLHKSLDEEEGVYHYFNYVRWTSFEVFREATSTEKFKELIKDFPGEGKPRFFRVIVDIPEKK